MRWSCGTSEVERKNQRSRASSRSRSSRRTRTAVARNTAFAVAGAADGTPMTLAPDGSAVDGTITVSTSYGIGCVAAIG